MAGQDGDGGSNGRSETGSLALSIQSNSSFASASTALGTPEVLETILQDLPLRDLLLAQRVNRTWRNTITCSRKLQEALFFKPATENASHFINTGFVVKKRVRGRPFTESYHQPASKAGSEASHWNTEQDGKGSRMRVIISPFVSHKLPWLLKYRTEYDVKWEMIVSGRASQALVRKEASWRRMLFTQSPVHNLLYDLYCPLDHWHSVEMDHGTKCVTLQRMHSTCEPVAGEGWDIAAKGQFLLTQPICPWKPSTWTAQEVRNAIAFAMDGDESFTGPDNSESDSDI